MTVKGLCAQISIDCGVGKNCIREAKTFTTVNYENQNKGQNVYRKGINTVNFMCTRLPGTATKDVMIQN